jgi:hypothetical protein
MKVWNIKVTDRGGFDSYSFIQDNEPTNQQLEAIRKIYQNSGRYIPEDMEDIYVEIKGSFDNEKIPTYQQLIDDLKIKYGKVGK